MPITVNCRGCGKTLRIKDDLAGKRGKCPGCGTALTIPEPSAGPALDFPDELELESAEHAPVGKGGAATATNCPECGEQIQPGAVICVSCGTDLKSGKKVRARKKPAMRGVRRSYFLSLFLMHAPFFACVYLYLFAVFSLHPNGIGEAEGFGFVGTLLLSVVASLIVGVLTVPYYALMVFTLRLPWLLRLVSRSAILVLTGVVPPVVVAVLGDFWSFFVLDRFYLGPREGIYALGRWEELPPEKRKAGALVLGLLAGVILVIPLLILLTAVAES